MTKTTTKNMYLARISAKALKKLSSKLKNERVNYEELDKKSEIVKMLEKQENLNELLHSMANEFDSWLEEEDDDDWVFTSNKSINWEKYNSTPESTNINTWCKEEGDCNLVNILNDLFKDKSELRKFIMKLYEKIVKNNKKKLGDEIDNLDKANDSLKKIQSCISDATTTDEMKMCTRQLGGSKSKKRKKSKRRRKTRKSKKRHKKRRKSKKRRKTKKK